MSDANPYSADDLPSNYKDAHVIRIRATVRALDEARARVAELEKLCVSGAAEAAHAASARSDAALVKAEARVRELETALREVMLSNPSFPVPVEVRDQCRAALSQPTQPEKPK